MASPPTDAGVQGEIKLKPGDFSCLGNIINKFYRATLLLRSGRIPELKEPQILLPGATLGIDLQQDGMHPGGSKGQIPEQAGVRLKRVLDSMSRLRRGMEWGVGGTERERSDRAVP